MNRSGLPNYAKRRDPTPAEIAKHCQAIRLTWDRNTREQRQVMKPEAVTVATISAREIYGTPDLGE
jgi:hypothetical protein